METAPGTSVVFWDREGRSCPAVILVDRGGDRVDVRALHPDGTVHVHEDTPHLSGPLSWSAPGERQVGVVLRAGGAEIERADDGRWAATGYRVPQNRDRPVAVGEPAIYRDPRQGPLLAIIHRVILAQPRRGEKLVAVDLAYVPSQEQLPAAIEAAFKIPDGFVPHHDLIAGSTWTGVSHGPGVGQWCWPLPA